MLYTTIQLLNPGPIILKQHLVVLWKMNDKYYSSMAVIGYDISNWFEYASLIGNGSGLSRPVVSVIEGTFNSADGTVTCKIPKNTIGNPKSGDVLTDIKSICFERFGFWGRIAIDPVLQSVFI